MLTSCMCRRCAPQEAAAPGPQAALDALRPHLPRLLHLAASDLAATAGEAAAGGTAATRTRGTLQQQVEPLTSPSCSRGRYCKLACPHASPATLLSTDGGAAAAGQLLQVLLTLAQDSRCVQAAGSSSIDGAECTLHACVDACCMCISCCCRCCCRCCSVAASLAVPETASVLAGMLGGFSFIAPACIPALQLVGCLLLAGGTEFAASLM